MLLGRRAVAILASVAVFFVTATCTSAGCALAFGGGHDAAVRSPCCPSPTHDRSHSPTNGERCPLCQASNLVGKTIEKSPVAPDWLAFLPVLNVAPVAPVALLSAGSFTPALRVSPEAPTTLLGLGCALQV